MIENRLLKDAIQSVATDTEEGFKKREKNAQKGMNMRMCICGHNQAAHTDEALYLQYMGVQRPENTTACCGNEEATCPCVEFIWMKERVHPCECGHDLRHHIMIEMPSGQKIVRCKYESCKFRCKYFKPTEEKEVSHAEMLALIERGKNRELRKKWDPLSAHKKHAANKRLNKKK